MDLGSLNSNTSAQHHAVPHSGSPGHGGGRQSWAWPPRFSSVGRVRRLSQNTKVIGFPLYHSDPYHSKADEKTNKQTNKQTGHSRMVAGVGQGVNDDAEIMCGAEPK